MILNFSIGSLKIKRLYQGRFKYKGRHSPRSRQITRDIHRFVRSTVNKKDIKRILTNTTLIKSISIETSYTKRPYVEILYREEIEIGSFTSQVQLDPCWIYIDGETLEEIMLEESGKGNIHSMNEDIQKWNEKWGGINEARL